MNNDDFRQLLSSLPKNRPSSTTSDSKKQKPVKKINNFHNKKKKDDPDKTEYQKIYDESQQNLQEILKGYRDRAAERRKVDTTKEAEEASLRLMIHGIIPTDKNKDLTVEQSRLLGGDLENTHMVRGLDYTLLEKMKTDKISDDENEDKNDERDMLADQIPPEKIAKNAMVRRMLRLQFHTKFPKRNEHFAPGRMAYICDFEDETTDVPSTLLRSLDITPKENPQVKNDKLILEHLTNILPYLRDKKRKKKKKDEQKIQADDGTKIFEDVGEYDTKIKPLKIDKSKKDDRYSERRSYFDDKRSRESRRDRDYDRRNRDDRRRDRDDDRRDRDRRDRDRRYDDERRRDYRKRSRSRSPRRRDRSPDVRKNKPVSALSEAIANESRKRASSPTSSATTKLSTKKKLLQDEAYGEYYTEDMDFVETIASDDDDDEALAMAKERMRLELGTDSDNTNKMKNNPKKFDKKRINPSKADIQRKLDSELKKMDEIWQQKKGKTVEDF